MDGILQYVQDDDDHGPIRVVFSALGVGNKVAEADADQLRTGRKPIEELKNLDEDGMRMCDGEDGVRMCDGVGERVCDAV